MKSVGIIIARFQTSQLSEDHKTLIEGVKQRHDEMAIILGVSPHPGSKNNPLDFPSREAMIKLEFPDVTILALPDHPLNEQWSVNLDHLVVQAFPSFSCRLYGSKKPFIDRYSGSHEVAELDYHDIRNTIGPENISSSTRASIEFRQGVVYAHSRAYSKVHATVDIAIFRNNRKEILLGRKEIDNKWRLLGGFSDPSDESFEASAKRELTEECGKIETTKMKYESSFRVDDWRYRSEEDKIISCLFSGDFMKGEPKGSDDISEVRWFSLNEIGPLLKTDSMAGEHYPQFEFLLQKYHQPIE